MNKKLIRLTESDLHRIVKESVDDVLSGNGGPTSSFRGKSTLRPKDVNFNKYQPNDHIGVLMSSLNRLWNQDQEYTLDLINRALGTNFTI